jgi:hypothetical protein
LIYFFLSIINILYLYKLILKLNLIIYMSSQNEDKYTKMINYSEKISNKYNYFIDLSCDKTLYEIMHSQTKYNLNTFDDVKFSLF